MNPKGRPPIIVLGCPRSGTSILTRMLIDLGVFMGDKMDILPTGEPCYEATFFSEIEAWMLGTGMGLAGLLHWFKNKEKLKLLEDYIRLLLTSANAREFMGEKLYKQYGTPYGMDIPWGWKNPSSTFTVRLWLSLFPGAKLIHIYRNAAAVALSTEPLQPATVKLFRRWLDEQSQKPRTEAVEFPPRGLSLPFLSLDDAFSKQEALRMWEIFTALADQALGALPPERKMAIKYETFLQNCAPALESLCQFAGVEPDKAKIEACCKLVNPDRIDAFKRNPDYLKMYEAFKTSPQMVKYGY